MISESIRLARSLPGLVVYRFGAGLYYANTNRLTGRSLERSIVGIEPHTQTPCSAAVYCA